ncbi:nitroreductase family protein [Ruminococcaceae bacterium OttesenSCG-928-A16]|nr:nitroreductase family protein [Ruminococcaceae bacterium OttesenSCG-928-A16]
MKDFLQAIANRRSIYTLSAESTITDERIEEILTTAVLNGPTYYNSQSSRAVLLLGANHAKLWQIVLDTLRPMVAPDKFGNTEKKIATFAAGYGSILFFDDTDVTSHFMEEYPTYRDTFPGWALQHNGMLQYAVWAALEAEGLGASLQHYNPLIDTAVQNEWNLPKSWQLLAQMPFGKPTALPAPKEKEPIETRMKIFK